MSKTWNNTEVRKIRKNVGDFTKKELSLMAEDLGIKTIDLKEEHVIQYLTDGYEMVVDLADKHKEQAFRLSKLLDLDFN